MNGADMTDETPRRDPGDEPVTEPVTPAPAAAPAPAVSERAGWRDRLPGRGGRSVSLGVAVVALLLGCLLGGGMVAVAAFVGHDPDDRQRHSDGWPGERGDERPGDRGGRPDRDRREHIRPDRDRPGPVPPSPSVSGAPATP
jgi:hypothetical protein